MVEIENNSKAAEKSRPAELAGNGEEGLNYLNLAGVQRNGSLVIDTGRKDSTTAGALLPELTVIEATKNPNTRLETHSDGSRVEFDTRTGKPVFAHDSKGNEYTFKWENGTSAPSYVSMQGPRTGGQLIEFKRNSLVDDIVNAAPGLLFTPALLMPSTHYGVWVDGREQQASLSLGAGAGAEGVSVGLSMPLQRGVNLKVNGDGTLVIQNPAETIQGVVQHRYSNLTLHLDGSTTQDSYSGWLFQNHQQVRRDPHGRVIR